MFSNFPKYVEFVIKRDKITSLIWFAGISVFALLLAAIYPSIFPDEATMHGMAATMNTPAMIAMMGPVYGFDALSPALMMNQQCLIWFAIAVIIMNIFFINRYTRQDEELGRQELLIALPIGRLTDSAVMIFLSFIINIIIAILIAIFTLITKIEGVSVIGALLYGLSIGMQGFVFAMITLLTAQLFSTASACMGAAFAVMGISYMLRAYGDMHDNFMSYISTMGLGLKVEAFYSNNFIPIIILFVKALIIAVLAMWVNSVRDIGAGIFPARKGKKHASKFLQTPIGFAWRLTSGSFWAWAIGIFALGASYGSVAGELDQFVEGNDMIKQMLQASGGTSAIADSYVAMIICMIAMLVSVPLINCINRLRTEEKRGRLEPIIATSVPRKTIFGSFILIAALKSIALMFFGAIGLYLAAYSSGLVAFGVLMKAAFVYLPALFVMFSFAVFLVGLLPKFKYLVWVLFGYSFIIFYFGKMFVDKIPEFALKLSPFSNIPELPVQQFSATPLIILCIISIIFTIIGVMGFEKRDIKN